MNQVILSGRLTKDVEVKASPNGTNYVRFSIAVDTYRNKEKGVQFIDCVAFGHQCNYLAKYCRKGTMLVLCGEMETRMVERDGKKAKQTTVIANTVESIKPLQKDADSVEDAVVPEDDGLPFEV